MHFGAADLVQVKVEPFPQAVVPYLVPPAMRALGHLAEEAEAVEGLSPPMAVVARLVAAVAAVAVAPWVVEEAEEAVVMLGQTQRAAFRKQSDRASTPRIFALSSAFAVRNSRTSSLHFEHTTLESRV